MFWAYGLLFWALSSPDGGYPAATVRNGGEQKRKKRKKEKKNEGNKWKKEERMG